MQNNGVKNWRALVTLLCAGWAVIWIYRTMLTPLFGEIQQTVGPQSGMAMGMISSCYFIGYVITQIPGGALMDRLGKRRVLLPGFALFGAGVVLVGLSRSMGMLYAGGLLAGVATGAYYSGAFSLTSQYVPVRYKFFATALVNNGCAIGMVVGLTASSLLVKQAGLPWQAVVFGTAVLAFAMVPFIAQVLRSEKPPTPTQRAQAAKGLGGLFVPQLVSSYFFYFATCYGYYMVVTWLPSFLETERGITGSAAGLTAAIVAVASIFGAMMFGKLLDRFQNGKILALGLLQLTASVMLLLTACLHSMGALVICLTLYGFTGKQSVDPLIVPHVSALNDPAALSTGLGVFNFFGMSASILAPFITGFIADVTGTKIYGFFLAAAVLGTSSLVFLAVNHKRGPCTPATTNTGE